MSTRGDELSRETLAAIVAAADPDWRLREARPATHGTDAVYHLTVDVGDGSRELVLKARTERDRPAFRAEPRLLDAVGRRSSVPVPPVVAVVEAPDLPDSFLMERLPGETITDPVDELDAELLDRIAFDAGRFLGSIAGVGEFERFGEVHLAEELDDPRVGVSGSDYELAVPGDAPTAWRERLSGMAAYFLDSIAEDSRFSEFVPALGSFLEERYDRLDGSERPALAHNDYHLWNVLVDADTGETTAVLDFAGQYTVPPPYELAGVESHLCGWVPVGHPRRKRVRERLISGFDRTHGIDRSRYEDRLGLYLGATALPGLYWFSGWKSQLGPDREVALRRRRAFLSSMVGESTPRG